uniref:alpha/beta fold hydrolase n=1 Tax=Polymorphobacter sp. TaxID=1909290 RepID=UPI003F7274C8
PVRWLRRLALAVLVLLGLIAALLVAGRVPDREAATLVARYAGPTSRFVTLSPGTTIHLRDEGPRDALPVLLLHGSNASLHTWEPWTRRLVAAGYRVISFDFPAHGLSGAVPDRDYSNAAYVRIVEAVVAELGLERFALGGNSMGGGIAWMYAVAHPGKVAALILVDATGKPAPEGSSPPLGFRLARVPVAREILATVTPRFIIDRSLRQSVSVQSIVTPAMVDRYWELLLYPGNREATLDRFSQYSPPPDAEALRRLTVPALVLWGAEDRLIPVEVAEWFSERLPNARVSILSGVGHIPMEEAPDRSLAPVLDLLRSVTVSPAAGTARQNGAATPSSPRPPTATG